MQHTAVLTRLRFVSLGRRACKELPPTLKKSACVEMASWPRTLCQIACRRASSSLAGATYSAWAAWAQSGAGSALRSTFSLGSSGMRSSGMTMSGTMCAGRRRFRSAVAAAGSTDAGVTYAARRCEPVGSWSTTATASWTPATLDSAFSISPSSTLKPRSLTWCAPNTLSSGPKTETR